MRKDWSQAGRTDYEPRGAEAIRAARDGVMIQYSRAIGVSMALTDPGPARSTGAVWLPGLVTKDASGDDVDASPGIEMETSNRWVAMFDYLGVSHRLQDPDFPISQFLHEYEVETEHLLRQMVVENPFQSKDPMVHSLRFADTVVLYSQASGVEDLGSTLRASNALLAAAIAREIPMRGAVTYGEIIVDEGRGLATGEGFARAHAIEKAQDWAGGILDPFAPRRAGVEGHTLESWRTQGVLHTWPVAFKNEGDPREVDALGWPGLVEASEHVFRNRFVGKTERGADKRKRAAEYFAAYLATHPPADGVPDGDDIRLRHHTGNAWSINDVFAKRPNTQRRHRN